MEQYEEFIEKYGKRTFHCPIDLGRMDEYDEFWMIPGVRSLLEKDGISSYMDGYLWTLDPMDYADWLTDWINGSTDLPARSLPFARTATGDILFVREKEIMLLNTSRRLQDYTTDDEDVFFNSYLTDDWFFDEYFNKKVYDQLPDKQLGPDECFGYEPLLSQGGNENPENLKKVNLKKYLEKVSKSSETVSFFPH